MYTVFVKLGYYLLFVKTVGLQDLYEYYLLEDIFIYQT